ncbi:unnamed protein product [Symbiodinium natans]|uniref:Uncharacterized protein n=1 Tax=Symbiodinium natans TaxID=878477 RepID=A0A812SJN0_9DINO|nr:unnamed protein product [Symbiodinium natans]
MHRMLFVAVSLCLAAYAGAVRNQMETHEHEKLVHLHQGQEDMKENFDKDLMGENLGNLGNQGHQEILEDKAVTKGFVCCRCHWEVRGEFVFRSITSEGQCSDKCVFLNDGLCTY